MSKTSLKPLWVVLIVIIVIQSATISYFVLEFNSLDNKLSLISTNVSSSIQSFSSDLTSAKNNINELSSSLMSTQTTLAESQSDLEKQISSIKAKTSSDFSGIIEDSTQAVVSIKTDVAQGTGFIVTSDGYVVTNAHVLEGAHYANAITSDMKSHPMNLISYNSKIDLALLKINGTYDYLTLDDSNNVKVGEEVIAIGNPLGLSFSVSEGIVSAIHRNVSNSPGEYIQTDTALNPGNSGGPLINKEGKVIGINNFKVSGGENIGFSLESNYIIDTINEMSQKSLNQTII
jgi:serine protease Do